MQCQWKSGCVREGTEKRIGKDDQGEFDVFLCGGHAAEVDARIEKGWTNIRFLLMTLSEPAFHQKVDDAQEGQGGGSGP